jgi:uncharacterized protein DUF2798
MACLPQRYAPFVYGIIQAGITTAIASAVTTLQLTGFGMQFLVGWAFDWSLSWLTMLPVVIGIAPLIQRMVVALTIPEVPDN